MMMMRMMLAPLKMKLNVADSRVPYATRHVMNCAGPRRCAGVRVQARAAATLAAQPPHAGRRGWRVFLLEICARLPGQG